MGKRVVFVTNTSRVRERIVEMLVSMGIERRLFRDVVSSGSSLVLDEQGVGETL